MFLNGVAVAAIVGHQVKDDDTTTMIVEVEPTGIVHQVTFNSGAVEGFEHDVGNGRRFSIRLEQFIHAVKHRQGGKRNGAKHDDSNAKRLPRGLLLKHAKIGFCDN